MEGKDGASHLQREAETAKIRRRAGIFIWLGKRRLLQESELSVDQPRESWHCHHPDQFLSFFPCRLPTSPVELSLVSDLPCMPSFLSIWCKKTISIVVKEACILFYSFSTTILTAYHVSSSCLGAELWRQNRQISPCTDEAHIQAHIFGQKCTSFL